MSQLNAGNSRVQNLLVGGGGVSQVTPRKSSFRAFKKDPPYENKAYAPGRGIPHCI